jgi:hypothetical protein
MRLSGKNIEYIAAIFLQEAIMYIDTNELMLGIQ